MNYISARLLQQQYRSSDGVGVKFLILVTNICYSGKKEQSLDSTVKPKRKANVVLILSTKKIHGPIYDNDYCRIKINQDIHNIHNKFKSPDNATIIKVNRCTWLQHILRVDGAKQ
jgi:hypothetical protein